MPLVILYLSLFLSHAHTCLPWSTAARGGVRGRPSSCPSARRRGRCTPTAGLATCGRRRREGARRLSRKGSCGPPGTHRNRRGEKDDDQQGSCRMKRRPTTVFAMQGSSKTQVTDENEGDETREIIKIATSFCQLNAFTTRHLQHRKIHKRETSSSSPSPSLNPYSCATFSSPPPSVKFTRLSERDNFQAPCRVPTYDIFFLNSNGTSIE